MIDRPTQAVLAASAVLFATGITWGWPDAVWAPDELRPPDVLAGLESGFRGNWSGIYAPLHFYILTAVYAPVLLLESGGWIADADATLVLLGRATSVVMALAMQIAAARLATQLLDRHHAWAAALTAGLFLPVVYYAKTTNVDMAYVCWFAWSLVWLADAFSTGRARSCVWFGVLAALAIGTKDQAYALYVLPSVLLAWRLSRTTHGRLALIAGAFAGTVTLAAVYNVVFNPVGWRDHIDAVTGAASADYRMFPSTIAGQAQLAGATIAQLWWTLGPAGVGLVCIGLARLIRARARAAAWLALVPASYYLTFIAPVGYVYDRFMLPILIIAAVVASAGVRVLLESSALPRRVATVAATVLLIVLAWRSASIDALLLSDSRYAAEAWLHTQVSPAQWVASIDQRGYLPRLEPFRHRIIPATALATSTLRPDFVVVNREHLERYGRDTARRAWIDWLESPESGYVEAFRHKHALVWSALAWDSRFTDRREDPFTNLDKINPEIRIYRRVPVPW